MCAARRSARPLFEHDLWDQQDELDEWNAYQEDRAIIDRIVRDGSVGGLSLEEFQHQEEKVAQPYLRPSSPHKAARRSPRQQARPAIAEVPQPSAMPVAPARPAEIARPARQARQNQPAEEHDLRELIFAAILAIPAVSCCWICHMAIDRAVNFVFDLLEAAH